jgi:hypothetical protein
MNALLKAMALVCLLTWAIVTRADNTELGNIHKGNIAAEGSASISFYAPSGRASSTAISVSPSLQYFVVDHLSIGGSLSYHHYSGSDGWTSWGIGPSITWHFWSTGHLSVFASEEIFLNKGTNLNWYGSNTAGLGMNYFITPSVAIGPLLQTYYQFENSELPSAFGTSLIGKFSIYF